MKLRTLEDLFLHELKDLLSAEHQMTKALPKMAKAANSPKLKQAFEDHLEETKHHVERLEQIFERMDKSSRAITCKAMKGLIAEGDELIDEDAEDHVRDAGLIGAAQRVEHYEIAGYGVARAFAELLGHSEAAGLLAETLEEEKMADGKLNELALSEINAGAVAAHS